MYSDKYVAMFEIIRKSFVVIRNMVSDNLAKNNVKIIQITKNFAILKYNNKK